MDAMIAIVLAAHYVAANPEVFRAARAVTPITTGLSEDEERDMLHAFTHAAGEAAGLPHLPAQLNPANAGQRASDPISAMLAEMGITVIDPDNLPGI